MGRTHIPWLAIVLLLAAPSISALLQLALKVDVLRGNGVNVLYETMKAGSPFEGIANKTEELAPDLVVMGKALSGGLPLSAVAGPEAVLKSWPPGMHTSTFQGNPLACAMAIATIETIREEALLARAREVLAPLMDRALKRRERRWRMASQSIIKCTKNR